MLNVQNEEHFAKVCDFAERKGPKHVESLWARLWWLHAYADYSEPLQCPTLAYGPLRAVPSVWNDLVLKRAETKLGYDFAVASFSFVITKAGERWFNGGLIYHGDQNGWIDRKGEPITHKVDSFSVSLVDAQLWSVHT